MAKQFYVALNQKTAAEFENMDDNNPETGAVIDTGFSQYVEGVDQTPVGVYAIRLTQPNFIPFIRQLGTTVYWKKIGEREAIIGNATLNDFLFRRNTVESQFRATLPLTDEIIKILDETLPGYESEDTDIKELKKTVLRFDDPVDDQDQREKLYAFSLKLQSEAGSDEAIIGKYGVAVYNLYLFARRQSAPRSREEYEAKIADYRAGVDTATEELGSLTPQSFFTDYPILMRIMPGMDGAEAIQAQLTRRFEEQSGKVGKALAERKSKKELTKKEIGELRELLSDPQALPALQEAMEKLGPLVQKMVDLQIECKNLLEELNKIAPGNDQMFDTSFLLWFNNSASAEVNHYAQLIDLIDKLEGLMLKGALVQSRLLTISAYVVNEPGMILQMMSSPPPPQTNGEGQPPAEAKKGGEPEAKPAANPAPKSTPKPVPKPPAKPAPKPQAEPEPQRKEGENTTDFLKRHTAWCEKSEIKKQNLEACL